MPDFPTFEDLFRAARDEALVRNPQLSRDAAERDGTDLNVLLAGGGAAADECIDQLVIVEASLFLDSATDTALDRLVFDRYGLVRKPAAPAIGVVVFSLQSPNPAPFVIPLGSVVSTGAGVQFGTTAAATFPAGSTSITVPVASLLAGLSQQAAIGTINSIVSRLTGAPATLAVNNTVATAGADDAESDDSLRNRARQFFVTARRGTKAAIVNGALAVAGVRTASVFEVLTATGDPGRLVQLVVSDAFTATLASFNPTPGTYQAQSQALANSVFAGLDDVRAAGIFVQVLVAQVVLLPIVLHLTFVAGADPVATTAAAEAIIASYTNNLAPGQPFSVSAAQALLKTVSGLFITGNELASPNGDVVPLTLQVLRTSPEIVTAPAV